MEAVGVGDWTPSNATLTKQTSSPYQGLRYMQSLDTAASPGYFHQPGILTVGKSYRISGAGGSYAGVAKPRLANGALVIWNGTTSVLWQEFDEMFVATVENLVFFNVAGDPGDGTKWDNIYLSLED
jgi:hypothetical protein